MRRRTAVAAALGVALALALAGCKRKHPVVQVIEEDRPKLATVVRMADPQAAAQLLSGFYGVEGNAWRWTAERFSVMLRPPRSAPLKGATLELKLTVPDVVIAKLKTVSLSATVNGMALGAEEYTKAGQYAYRRDLPAKLLPGDSARVDFILNKSMPPTVADNRPLGVIVASVGLAPHGDSAP